MTVKELIGKLQTMPQDLTVINESCSLEVEIVEVSNVKMTTLENNEYNEYVGIV